VLGIELHVICKKAWCSKSSLLGSHSPAWSYSWKIDWLSQSQMSISAHSILAVSVKTRGQHWEVMVAFPLHLKWTRRSSVDTYPTPWCWEWNVGTLHLTVCLHVIEPTSSVCIACCVCFIACSLAMVHYSLGGLDLLGCVDVIRSEHQSLIGWMHSAQCYTTANASEQLWLIYCLDFELFMFLTVLFGLLESLPGCWKSYLPKRSSPGTHLMWMS